MNAVGKSVGLCCIRCGIVDQSIHILIEQRAVLIDEGGIALSNVEGGDTRTVREGIAVHIGKRCGKNDLLYLNAVLERKRTNRLKSVGHVQCLDVRASCECSLAYGAKTTGELNGGNTLTVHERFVGDSGELGEVDSTDSGIAECACIDSVNACREVNGCKRGISAEGISSYGLKRASLCEGDRSQCRTALEAGRTDAGRCCGNVDLCDLDTSLERILTDSLNVCRNGNVGKLGTACEQVIGNCCKSGGKFYGDQTRTLIKGLCSESLKAVSEYNSLEIDTACKGLISDSGKLASLCKDNSLKRGGLAVTGREGLVTQSGNTGRNSDALKSVVVEEHLISKDLYSLFKSYVGKSYTTGEKVIGKRAYCSGDLNRRKRVTIGKYVSTKSLHSVRNIDRGDTGCFKCSCAYARKP